MQSETRIEIARLTKEFRVERAGPASLFNRLRRAMWLEGETRGLRAVSDVTFRLERGRSLGLVGNNGAGQSTLLRLLRGIYRPTTATCRIHGRLRAVGPSREVLARYTSSG